METQSPSVANDSAPQSKSSTSIDQCSGIETERVDSPTENDPASAIVDFSSNVMEIPPTTAHDDLSNDGMLILNAASDTPLFNCSPPPPSSSPNQPPSGQVADSAPSNDGSFSPGVATPLPLTLELPQPEPTPSVTPPSNEGNASCSPSEQKPFSPVPDSPIDFVYQIKWIQFRGQLKPIITQNENGPCPMISIANVLLLRGTIALDWDSELISGQRLLFLLSDTLLTHSSSQSSTMVSCPSVRPSFLHILYF